MKAFIFVLVVVGAVADSNFNWKQQKSPVGKCPAVNGEDSTYLMDLNNRGIFYECNAGVPYEQSCPAGLVFNPKLNVCDFPCMTCEPSGPVGNCNGAGFIRLKYLRDGINVAVYYVCNIDKAVRYNCPPGEIYNTLFKVCFNPY